MLPAPALAADPPPSVTARLEYDVPAQGCPPASVLRVEFARRLGYDFVVEDAPLRVVVKIAREKGALASSLSLYDSAGKQLWTKPAIFPAWQCLTLVHAMAGLLAVRFDPLVFRAAAVEAPPPAPPLVPPPPLPPPPVSPKPEPAPPPRPVTAPPPVPPKRSFRLVAGIDGVFTSSIAPSASAGVDLWAAVDLLHWPFSFELDMRLTTSLVPADVKLPYQRHTAVHSSYISAVVAGCLRLPVSLCPLLEIGSMSFSDAGPPGEVLGPSATVVAAGLRGVYERRLTERIFVRGFIELEGIPRPASMWSDALPGEVDQPARSPSRLSLSGGVGFAGSLW